MSGGRRSKLSPSLFPFLAVLVCTLGTLILLLAMVAEKANDAAVAAAQKSAETSIAQAEAKPAGLSGKSVDMLIEEAQFRVTQLVSTRNLQTADIEDRRDKIAHVEDHTGRLQEELKRLSDEVDRATGQQSDDVVDEAQLAILRKEIDIEKEELKKLAAESDGRKPRIVIVPHKGPNGTDRRPVYLECSSDGLVIWPEKVRISQEQLERSDVGANPVESALRVIRNHSMSAYGDAAAPYPLLIVRPDGIKTYAAARGAMQDYDDQFGYELVPADIELAQSSPDPVLKQKINNAVAKSISNQARRAVVASRNNVRSGNRLPVLSAAAMDQQGRSSGFRSLGRDQRNLYTEQASDARSIARSYASNQSTLGKQSSTTSYGTGNSYGDSPSDLNGGIDPAMEKKWGDDMRQAASEMRGNAFDENGNPKSLMDQFGSAEPGAGGESETDMGLDPKTLSRDAAASPDSNATYSASDKAAAGSASTKGTAGASSPNSRAASGSPTSDPASEQSSTKSPPPPNRYSQTATQDLVNPQAKDWALPRDVARSNGNSIVRTIRAESHGDRFVLLPSARGGSTEMFGVFNRDFQRSALELATAVRDRVDQWGVALPGGRWRPTLEVDVKPGGELRFEQLQRMMQGSGVNIIARPQSR